MFRYILGYPCIVVRVSETQTITWPKKFCTTSTNKVMSSRHQGTSLLTRGANLQWWHGLRREILKDQPVEVHVPVLCGPWEFLTKIWVCRVVMNYRIWELVVCDQSTYLWPAVTSFWSQNFRPRKSCSELRKTEKNEEKIMTKFYR